MASNFQILSYKTRDSFHLKLDGDFDGNSAYELINVLRDHGAEFFQIFIDTNNLKTVHAFGREVFQKNFGALKQLSNLIFIGENGRQLAQY
jgi:hypothetical protein